MTCASKNDMRNLTNFHQSTFKSLKIGTLIGSFYPKLKMNELRIYREVMCHDNEAWFKTWWGIDLSVQNWHEQFDKFGPEYSKISKICALMDCFWWKYIMFGVNKYREVMFDGTGYWCKMWRKIDWCFQKWHEEFGKFSPEHIQKTTNWDFYWVLLSKVENVWA